MKRFGFIFMLLLVFVPIQLLGQQEEPSYGIYGNDTTVQVFLYSPGSSQGLHLSYLGYDNQWKDLGQICASEYGLPGMSGSMFDPFVISVDGSYRLLFGVGKDAVCFGVSSSEDLVHWRPQDFPVMTVRGCRQPIAFTNSDNGFDIYFRSKEGPRYLSATNDFRKFSADESSTIEDIAWLRDTATIGEHVMEGTLLEIAKVHFDYISRYLQALANDKKMSSLTMADGGTRFASLPNVSATLRVDMDKPKSISNHILGISFEDVDYAAKRGLSAEMIDNGDFEGSPAGNSTSTNSAAWLPLAPEGKVEIDTVYPFGKTNPHYVSLSSSGIVNKGFEGMNVWADSVYTFSVQARLLDPEEKKKKLNVILSDSDGNVLADGKLTVAGGSWAEYRLPLIVGRPKDKKDISKFSGARLSIVPQGDGRVGLDMVSLSPNATFKGHGMRRDMAESIAALHPKFMRFSVGGLARENVYNKVLTDNPHTGRSALSGSLLQNGLSTEAFFRLCDDLGCEPLPIVAAGDPSPVTDASSLEKGVAMKDMAAYCDELLKFIECARRNHHLSYIGIAGAGHVTTAFEERCLMMCKAIKQRYPDMKIIVSAGQGHNPSADNIEGWEFAKAHKDLIDMVDEKFTESAGWLLSHPDYYDDYDRRAAKVSNGEYACLKPTMESALAEACFLCNVERNGDVAATASYGPLLRYNRNKNSSPALISFDKDTVMFAPSYYTQLLFSSHSGNRYMPSTLELTPQEESLKGRVCASVVGSSAEGMTYLRLVNTLPRDVSLRIEGLNIPEGSVMTSFSGRPSDETTTLEQKIVGNSLVLSPDSVSVIAVK